MAPLSPAQLADFDSNGFLLCHDVLPPEVLHPLIAEFTMATDRKVDELQAEGRLGPDAGFGGAPFDRRLGLICEAAPETATIQELWTVGEGKHMKTAGLFGILTHPPLLDIVESVVGAEVLAHPQFNSRAKLPGSVLARVAAAAAAGAGTGRFEKTQGDRGSAFLGTSPIDGVKYHQDSSLLDREVDLNVMANFWVPLVEAPIETGPLRVIPVWRDHTHCSVVSCRSFSLMDSDCCAQGSHKWGLLLPSYPSRERIDEAASAHPHSGALPSGAVLSDEGGRDWTAVDCPVRLGSALLIHERLMHCSTPNTSESTRWSLDLRFCSALAPTGRAGTPGFIARSAADPGQVARSHHDWLALFDEDQQEQERRQRAEPRL